MAVATKCDYWMLVENLSASDITIFLYSSWNPFNIDVFATSKIIKGITKCECMQSEPQLISFDEYAPVSFAVKVRAQVLLGPAVWTGPTKYIVTKELDMVEVAEIADERLGEALEEEACLIRRKINKDCETNQGCLYSLLRLDERTIRKLSRENQDMLIKNAFVKELMRWHPTFNAKYGDNEIASEIIAAYDVLHNHGLRAAYHNVRDYQKGWFSLARWCAIFWPETCTDAQLRDWKMRIGMLTISLGLCISGVVLTVASFGGTAGLILPIIGSCILQAGIQGGLRSVSRHSVLLRREQGIIRPYLISTCLGFLGGLLVGGTTLGIEILNLSSIALTHAMGFFMGTTSVFFNELERHVLEGDTFFKRDLLTKMLTAGLLGGVVSFVGERVAYSVKLSLINTARKLSLIKHLRVNVSKAVAEGATSAFLDTSFDLIMERVSPNKPNQCISHHLLKSAKLLLSNVTFELGKQLLSSDVLDTFCNDEEDHPMFPQQCIPAVHFFEALEEKNPDRYVVGIRFISYTFLPIRMTVRYTDPSGTVLSLSVGSCRIVNVPTLAKDLVIAFHANGTLALMDPICLEYDRPDDLTFYVTVRLKQGIIVKKTTNGYFAEINHNLS